MDWLKNISKGWIVAATLAQGTVYAEPREVLYTAILEMAEKDDLPALNAPDGSVSDSAPPVAPEIQRPVELPPLEPASKSRLRPTDEILPLELVPERRPASEVEQREVVQEKYPSGAIKIERHVRQDAEGNYIHDGTWRWFNPKGQTVAEGEYVNDRREGMWRRMYRKEDSPIFATSPYKDFEPPFLSEAAFENGKLHGPWMISDAKNRKISEINFEAGIRQGPATWWHVQGSPLIQSNFEKGELQGDVFTFTADGKTASHDVFDRGRKLEKKTDKFVDGKTKVISSQLSGHWKLTGNDDWWTASLCKFEVVGQPLRHGKVATYYRNGMVQSEQEFREGKPLGQVTWWHENGQKALIGAYDSEGAAMGRWTWWHKNGLKSIEGEYVAGKPTGKWLAWDSQGRVSSRGNIEEKGNEVIATKPTTSSNFDNFPTQLGLPRPAADE